MRAKISKRCDLSRAVASWNKWLKIMRCSIFFPLKRNVTERGQRKAARRDSKKENKAHLYISGLFCISCLLSLMWQNQKYPHTETWCWLKIISNTSEIHKKVKQAFKLEYSQEHEYCSIKPQTNTELLKLSVSNLLTSNRNALNLSADFNAVEVCDELLYKNSFI